MRTTLVLALLAALLLAGAADSRGPATPTASKAASSDLTLTAAGLSPTARQEKKVIAKTNAHRKRKGCAPLVESWQLRRAARWHSARMASHRTMSHQLPGEAPLGVRVRRAGYKNWTRIGENIAVGQRWAGQVVRAWMNSPGHRRNMLNCTYRQVGVGKVHRHGRVWWTQVLGRK